MKLSPLALVLALLGTAGSLEAGKPVRKGKPGKSHKVATAKTGTYKIQKGDTAAKVARQFKLDLSELKALNPKINLAKLSVGTLLQVAPAAKAEPTLVATVPEAEPTNRPPVIPAPPLPNTPALRPSTLTHLERMLPATTQESAPQGSAKPEVSPRSAWIQPIFGPLPLATEEPQPQDLGFLPANPDALDLLWPVETRTVSSGWGPRMRTRTVVKVKAEKKRKVRVRYRGSHRGVDLNAPQGTDVYAALDGRVIDAGRHRQYGNFVTVDHGNGVVTLYAHHRVNFAQIGDVVRRGQKIAEVGRTGNASGPHLHFELRIDGAYRNPLPMLNDVEEIPAEMMARNESSPFRSRR